MRILAIFFLLAAGSCQYYNGKLPVAGQAEDTTEIVQVKAELPSVKGKDNYINTGSTKPEQLLAFAKSLMGTPYRYGSSDPVNGFDCSGFITYVFNHFNIVVPRSSIDFTHYKTQVELKQAKEGDLILFTGTDSTIREVGHMGIITSVNNGEIEFIHSSSGKANGVTITPLNTYYAGRFVKVIRVF
jgi:cell wall-associated NlpC family hydrolase